MHFISDMAMPCSDILPMFLLECSGPDWRETGVLASSSR